MELFAVNIVLVLSTDTMDKRRDQELVVHGVEPVSPLPKQNVGEIVYNSLKAYSRRKVAFVSEIYLKVSVMKNCFVFRCTR